MIFFYFTWVRETNKISFAHNKSREGIRQKRKTQIIIIGLCVCISRWKLGDGWRDVESDRYHEYVAYNSQISVTM
jgi:hypothetical protein